VRVAILGAAGTIAPAIVRDLAESDEIESLLLLDRDGDRARELAGAHGAGKATAATVDASDRQALTLALEEYALLVNAASYRVNLAAMDACLASRTGYIDLGGLYHVTAQQLRMHDAFAAEGLLAVLGCGAGPGKTNVMAARAAAELDDVVAVRCASAGLDADPPPGLSTPYALQTLIDELTLAPVVVRDGEPVEFEPLTDGGTIGFPAPVGERGSIYTLHSEVLTLPGSLGARDCDFRLSLAPAVHEALLGLLDTPRAEIAAMRPAPPSPRTWSAQHVEVTGTRDGEPAAVEITALTRPHEEWGLGGGIVSTASVAAATARLYARAALPPLADPLGPAGGVLPPERALTPELLFAELEARGCTFAITTTTPSEVS
jgi:saccharopine dehydrogenase-like NADP-dependent oxidoreductase